MEKEVVKNHHHHSSHNKITTTPSRREKHLLGDGFVRPPQSSADFVLRWGNRKRLRCMKIQVKNDSTPASRTTVRVDRRVVRSDNNTSTIGGGGNHPTNGHFNLRQRPASPAQPPLRILRNTEGASSAMKGHNSHNNNNYNNGNNISHNQNQNHNHNHNHNSNGGGAGGMRGLLASPEREKKGGAHQDNMINGNGNRTASSETKGGGGGTSSGGGGGSEMVWPPKFVIPLTNKEKEEDFLAIKGSKLPQRPKKRAKFIQRTLNLVSPGGWLCDLTLDRYEVREKKISKKRPRGLKALGNYMESDSD